MASLMLYRNKLKHNYKRLSKLLAKDDRQISIVTKLLCGNKLFIDEVLQLGCKQVCDSRLSNLKTIKKLNPKIETVYIKPPAKNQIKNLVSYADISLNTQLETLKLISREAQKQKKIHKVIIMIEMGDLREGVMKEDLIKFYSKVFKLKGIKVVGLGTNFNCLHGVMPSQDKLIQLSLYSQIIELKFKKKIPLVSAGSTVVLPLVKKKLVPKEVNHFRIGEALFFGADLFENKTMSGFYPSVFDLRAQIIELEKKPYIPDGNLQENPSGQSFEIDDNLYGKSSYRAIVDIGLLDVNPDFIFPKNKNYQIVGGSSDMLVVDLKDNPDQLKMGDLIDFDMKYMGALSLMNSRYVEKLVV
jgi:predicted amino acid racemase